MFSRVNQPRDGGIGLKWHTVRVSWFVNVSDAADMRNCAAEGAEPTGTPTEVSMNRGLVSGCVGVAGRLGAALGAHVAVMTPCSLVAGYTVASTVLVSCALVTRPTTRTQYELHRRANLKS